MEKDYMEDHLTCPICFEIPKNEIIQCRNGHLICGPCRKPLTWCPQCRITYDKEDLRNLAMESLLDAMEFHCPFTGEGCPAKLSRKDLHGHEAMCKFSPVTKLFCSRHLGWKDCKVAIDESSVLSHLEEQHPVKNVDCSTFQIGLDYEELSPEDNVDVYFDPLVITSLTSPIVLRTVMTGSSQIALTCFMFRDTEVVVDIVERFRVNYRIDFDKGTGITWTGYVESFRKFDKISNRNSFCIPMHCLEELANQKGTSSQSTSNDAPNINIKVTVFKETDSAPPDMLDEAIHTVNISEQIRLPRGQGPLVIFRGVRCNICKMWPIKMLRYKCLQCPDYDLCKKCAEEGHHNHHFFVRLHDMSQSAQFYNQFWRKPNSNSGGERNVK